LIAETRHEILAGFCLQGSKSVGLLEPLPNHQKTVSFSEKSPVVIAATSNSLYGQWNYDRTSEISEI